MGLNKMSYGRSAMQCYFIDSYVQSTFSYYTTPEVNTSAIALTMMHGNCLLIYVHSSMKVGNAVLYSILLFLSTHLVLCPILSGYRLN